MHTCAYARPTVRPARWVRPAGPDMTRPAWLPVDWTWTVEADTIRAASAPWLLGAEEVVQVVVIRPVVTGSIRQWKVQDGSLRAEDGCPVDWPETHVFSTFRDARAYLAYLAEDDADLEDV